jgi:hypothetical protein
MASNSDNTSVSCGGTLVGILTGFWVAFTFNAAIILCIALGLSAGVAYSILAGIAVLIAKAVQNS